MTGGTEHAGGETAYRSLYRRYRPQRFAEVKGQDRVVGALRNAVRDGRVSHAYLFSGPRGTGKTSTARILAKALNCAEPRDGEPCCECASCLQVQAGSSLDVVELDAASNNGVEAMRDLVARAALGTPGRWKVYIVDEVHMLSAAASNALLKTLEEPPGHVVFVLATTDPQKVVQTIRSRTQHFEFRLLGADVLGELVREVSTDAGLELAAEALDAAVRRGRGSARDALSALEQVAAGGEVDDEVASLHELVGALAERDSARALLAVASACAEGRDPQRLAADLVAQLRNGFLARLAPDVVPLPDAERRLAAEEAEGLGLTALVRALEVLGQALVDMREALDPRVCLEVALVRVTTPEADTSPAALAERLDRLERRMAATGPPGSESEPGGHPAPPPPAAPEESEAGPRGPRAALGAIRRQAQSGAAAPAPPPPSAPVERVEPRSTAPEAPLPTRDELTMAWGDQVYPSLVGPARSRFSAGRFVTVDGGSAVFALPNAVHRDRCEERRAEVEEALATHFGRPVPLQLVVEAQAQPGVVPPPAMADEDVDMDGLNDAPATVTSVAERVKQAFPGAQEV